MHDFRKLDVWQLSMKVARDVYRLTTGFPSEERYGLTSQMRRAAVSIASNIAEGVVRQSLPDIRRFLVIARGSSAELETQMLLAESLGFIDTELSEQISDNLDRIRAMLVQLGRHVAPSPT